MRRFLQRFPSLVARNLHHSKINPRVTVPSLTSRFAFFSSESNSVVSKEELKKRIQSFLDDGDEDAIPDLFEAMMTRKLSGKHDESDDEVMEEVRKYPINDAHKVDDNVSDGDSSGSDFESDDDLRGGDSSDSDVEIDGLKDDDLLSDLGIKIDGLKDVDLLSGLDIKIDGLKDVDLSGLGIKIDGLKPDQSSCSDSESD